MLSLVLIFLLAAGESDAVFWQRLTCPYQPEQQNLLRVWCRQVSAECCTGLAFSHGSASAHGGQLRVTQDGHSFTVEVLEPSHRGGVYWCGLLGSNNTIIKLAEAYLHSSPAAFIWSLTRWILLPLLPIVTIFTHVYTIMKTKRCCEKDVVPDDDVNVGGALTDPDGPDSLESSGI